MMLHASTQKLIVKLCELTEAGHIAWKHGDGRTCRFDTEGYVVEVQSQPARLRLLHSDGRELERADEPDLAAQPWPDGEGTFATQIVLLAARADRIARGAEFAISRILSSLSAPPKSAPFDFIAGNPRRSAEPAPPPAPHTMPGPPPDPVVGDAAVASALDVEPRPPAPIASPAPQPAPVVIESETAAIVGDPEAIGGISGTAEDIAEPPPPESQAIEAAPVVIEAETVAIVSPSAVEPSRFQEQPAAPEPGPKPIPRVSPPRPQDMFGATTSFARPGALPAAPAAPRASSPKPFSTSPLFFGVNQMPREPVRAEPEPPPVPPPAAKPVPQVSPAADRKPAPAGPEVYKPWS
jgi:hypothetical protein